MDKEYGVELDVDLSSFNAKLDEAVSKVRKASNDIEKTTRTIKVTGVEGLDKIKVDTAPVKRLKSELQDTLDVKKRLETGQIKVFDSNVFDSKSMAKADAEYEKNRLARSGFVDYGKLEADRNAFEQLGQSINDVDSNLEEATTSGNQFLVTIERLVARRLGRRTFLGTEFFNKTFFNDMKDGTTTLQSFSASLLKLGGATLGIYGIKKLFDLAINSIKKAKEETERYKKIVLGVFTSIINGTKQLLSSAVGYMQNFFNKALNSYMSFDQQLTKNIQNVWAGLGSYLAPILEYIVSLFQRLLAYINATIKVLTGVDFIARANAKAMNGVASSTAKATKALAGFDELQNIERESGGGGGISGGGIEIPDIDTSNVESFAKKIKEMIDQDNWKGIGLAVRDKIMEGLDSIDWGTIQAKATTIGKRLAEFLNGLFTPNIDGRTLGASLGKALANAINTAISFLDGFLETIDWDLVAQNIMDFIVESIENINWEKVISVAQKIADGILKILKTAIKKLNEKLPEWLEAFDKFLHSAEGQEFLNTIAQIITTWQELKDQVNLIFDTLIDEVKGILMDKLGKTPWASKFASAYAKVGTKGLFGTFFSNAKEEVKSGSAKVEKQSYESGNKSGKSYEDGYDDADIVSSVAGKYKQVEDTNESWSVKISAQQYESGRKESESYNEGTNSVDTKATIEKKMQGVSDALTQGGDLASQLAHEIATTCWTSYNTGSDSVDTKTPTEKKTSGIVDVLTKGLDISGDVSKIFYGAGEASGEGYNKGLNDTKTISKTEDYFNKLNQTLTAPLDAGIKQTDASGKNMGSSLGLGIQSAFNGVIGGALQTVRNGLNNVIGLFNQSADNIGRNYNIKIKGSIANGVMGAGNIAQDVVSNVIASVRKIPYLSIGTNEVYSEGLAYLHTGEKVVPANVAKGGYDSSDNKETNMLLRVLIDTLENKDFNATIGKDEVGRASVDYINKMKRITGGAIV